MDLIQSYKEELQLIRKPWTRVWVAVFVLSLILLPWVAPQHITYITTIIFIYSIGVQGQNLLIGYTGQISFGQAGFLAIGAFTFGHLSIHGVPWFLSLLGAGLAAGLFGLVVGFPSLRLKGPYLAIATMGFGIAVYQVFVNSETLSGGRMGMAVQKLSPLFGFSPITTRYYFNFLMAALFTLASYNIISSYLGRAFIAIRDRDIAAELIGINVFKYKLVSFAISSFYAGVAGGLWCYYMTIINPEAFQLSISIDYVAMIIVGGMGTLFGSVYGAVFVVLLPEAIQRLMEVLQPVLHMEYTFAAFKQIVFGVIIVIFLVFEPKGLSEIFSRLGGRISKRKGKEASESGGLAQRKNDS